MPDETNILLGHGSGGHLMHKLINDVFIRHFSNDILLQQTDAALLHIESSEIAFTTDSFVIDPLFFPGGDIGKLAVCGTVNDLAVSGAIPLYLSVACVIEEGFPLSQLDKIAASIAAEASIAGVQIVTGDTKVVNKGKCDKIFINTAGIGRVETSMRGVAAGNSVAEGDVIIVSGSIGDHGMAVMNVRESFNFKSNLESDCASLNGLIQAAANAVNLKFMRDPTRGGVATVLNELAVKTNLGVVISEPSLIVKPAVKALCELLGFDPLHVANEGKVVIVVSPNEADLALKTLRNHPLGTDASIIGHMVNNHSGRVLLENETGGRRIIEMLSGDQLPRIC